jgi:mannose-6-phosphate isomerase-like protein (cupin superfamily)
MLQIERKVRQLPAADWQAQREECIRAAEPLLLKGLVADWPAVRAGLQSVEAGIDYLRGFYRDATVGAWIGGPEIGGRFFYNADLTGFNYQPIMVKLGMVFDRLLQHRHDAAPPAIYVGSTTVDTCLPGFRAHNDLDPGSRAALASVWIGNRGRVAAHYDVPDNVACVVAGHRRFTLFPPGEVRNLYVGPLHLTPAGQPISLVDFAAPDIQAFPRFADAVRSARVAELEPGDAVFIPSMWWHHVEALDAFNVLVNYWWRQSPAYMDTPANALMHALLGVRDLPPAQRAAWREIFRHYVFEADATTAAHIPEASRGVLSPIDDERARELRALLLNRLNR